MMVELVTPPRSSHSIPFLVRPAHGSLPPLLASMYLIGRRVHRSLNSCHITSHTQYTCHYSRNTFFFVNIVFAVLYVTMSPSATAPIVKTIPKTQVSEVSEKHAHGGEDKTPLEAISHGPLIQQGMHKNTTCFVREIRSLVFHQLSKTNYCISYPSYKKYICKCLCSVYSKWGSRIYRFVP